ncbi:MULTISPECIES: hypothetical protein [Streptosporangium]|uniref:Uncharacterized protein n=1 Tax=Streptosporangium brasiliense TaxID=47480 RepID=A0ABT9R6A7_9ACTN|nr:hypothetical protein [Streptosporangium brasiliense]MDP9864774.1 hypothetical protein [Streptosporangium brasiliense]
MTLIAFRIKRRLSCEERSRLVPPELVPYAALAEEWSTRMIAQAPERSPEAWRRVAAIYGIEFSHEIADAPAPVSSEAGRDAAA